MLKNILVLKRHLTKYVRCLLMHSILWSLCLVTLFKSLTSTILISVFLFVCQDLWVSRPLIFFCKFAINRHTCYGNFSFRTLSLCLFLKKNVTTSIMKKTKVLTGKWGRMSFPVDHQVPPTPTHFFLKSHQKFFRKKLSSCWQHLYTKNPFALYTKQKQGVILEQALAQCLKIKEKVSFDIASGASYVCILSEQKFIKNDQF